MESKIHSDLRVMDIDIGGAFIIPASGDAVKNHTKPLGLTLWAKKVDDDKW